MSLTAKNARNDCPWRPMAEMGRGSGMLFGMEGTPSSPPLFSVIASPNVRRGMPGTGPVGGEQTHRHWRRDGMG